MLLNNRASDIKRLLESAGLNQTKYADKFDEDCSNVRNIVNRHGPSVSKRYIQMCERLGYDIKLEYIKRQVKSA